ncbi:MAG: hypothetical protein KAJ47_00365 [Candidatus Aenigmarchaeota archaeon]|nr:hypothetical protein [Candidatus Aenigmarchaeota archaeon]
MIKIRRKGVIYTLFALFVIATFAPIIFYVNTENQRTSDEMISKLRSDELYFFMADLRKDIERSIIISTKRAIIATTSQTITDGKCVDNVSAVFLETIFNGTINGTPSHILNGSTLDDWIQNVVFMSSDIGIDCTVDIHSISFNTSSSPFTLNITSSVNFIASDPSVEITFNKSYIISQPLRIDLFEDPYLSVYSNSYIIRKFNICNHTERLGFIDSGISESFSEPFISGYVTTDINSPYAGDKIFVSANKDGLDTTDLNSFRGLVFEENINTTDLSVPVIEIVAGALASAQDNDYFVMINSSGSVWFNNILSEIESGCYFEDLDAPSFFDRFECSSAMSPDYNVTSYGLATFVDLRSLPQSMRLNNTAIDYLYFSGYSGSINRLMGVSNELSWFMLDNDHITSMGAQSLIY